MSIEGIQIAAAIIVAFILGLITMWAVLGHARRIQDQASANTLDLLDWRAARGLGTQQQLASPYMQYPEPRPFQPDYDTADMTDEERQLRAFDALKSQRMTDEREAAIADRTQ